MAQLEAAKWHDLGLRTLSAVLLIPAVLLVVWLGGVWFSILIALVGVVTALEWTNLAHRQDALQFTLHAAAGLCGAFLPPSVGVLGATGAIAALWLISAALTWRAVGAIVWRYLGVPYVGFPGLALVQLREDANFGLLVILWILVIVWAADTLAYFAGRIIGGPKLAPIISPKKTWAGLAGAIVGGAIASAMFAAVMNLDAVGKLALLGGFLALVAQAGDLFKSGLKRHYGVKDSGRLIPGHGGIIDRVDGLVAAAVVAALVGLARSGPMATGAGLLLW